MIPMVLSLFILERRARLVIGYLLAGSTVCLFISELNWLLYTTLGVGTLYFCTTVSPVTEELIKTLPILFYAFFFANDRKGIVQASFAVGLGFAILENLIIITQNTETITIPWVIVRGFGAGLMHSICTLAVGFGISFVRQKKQLFICGTLALLALAITYHSIYNTIVMSPYKYCGIALPLVTYIPVLITYLNGSGSERSKKKEKGEQT